MGLVGDAKTTLEIIDKIADYCLNLRGFRRKRAFEESGKKLYEVLIEINEIVVNAKIMIQRIRADATLGRPMDMLSGELEDFIKKQQLLIERVRTKLKPLYRKYSGVDSAYSRILSVAWDAKSRHFIEMRERFVDISSLERQAKKGSFSRIAYSLLTDYDGIEIALIRDSDESGIPYRQFQEMPIEAVEYCLKKYKVEESLNELCEAVDGMRQKLTAIFDDKSILALLFAYGAHKPMSLSKKIRNMTSRFGK